VQVFRNDLHLLFVSQNVRSSGKDRGTFLRTL